MNDIGIRIIIVGNIFPKYKLKSEKSILLDITWSLWPLHDHIDIPMLNFEVTITESTNYLSSGMVELEGDFLSVYMTDSFNLSPMKAENLVHMNITKLYNFRLENVPILSNIYNVYAVRIQQFWNGVGFLIFLASSRLDH